MGFLVSPGFVINEVDQTNTVPATSTSVGAYAGHFNWGPVEDIVTVGSEKELAQYFGAPTQGGSTRSFLTAASYLKYSNALRVSRALGLNATNAADSQQILIKNKDHFDTLSSLDFVFSARYPGALGNSISVSYAYVAGSSDSDYKNWEYASLFDSAPNQSLTAQENGILTNDEIHLVVVDRLGLITGSAGSILERYEGLSLGSNAKNEDGASIFYRDVINDTSSYIFVNSLNDTFDEADNDITVDSTFAVEASSTSTESTLNLPFKVSVETTTVYSGGGSVVTTENQDKTIVAKSGFSGSNGNNVKINVRGLAVDDAPSKDAAGYIDYNAPDDGDTITIGESTYTKAASGGLSTFSTIEELTTLIDGGGFVSDVTQVGTNTIVFVNNQIEGGAEVSIGENNTGTLFVSGMTSALSTKSLSYINVDIANTQSDQGYVTYDVEVAFEEDNGSTVTDVTLGDIIKAINVEIRTLGDANIELPSFYLDGVEITYEDALSSMVLDLQELLPFANTDMVLLNILSFSGGEVVTFNDNTLINTYNFNLGSDGTATQGGVATALNLFIDKELIDINLLFAETFNTDQETIDSKLYEIANTRKDIIATIAEPISVSSLTSNAQKLSAVIDKFDSKTYSSSSYIVFTQTPVYTYNKYADKYLWIPSSGHVAGLCANADLVAEPWFSPAGFNRGQLKGVTKIAYNPSQTDRDELYKKRINSIVAIPGEGIILYGDKTALSKSSAFGRINVRRLFNVLERSISEAAKYQLFELNDEFTRASFKNTIEPFLRDVQGRRGIIEFRVICDETNNTEEVIDGNEFVGDIYIKPARSINFIRLNFIASRTGVDFKEIVGN